MLSPHSDLALLAAFLIGLMGSVHCIGMCGGIVGVLTLGVPQDSRRSPARTLLYMLSYNLGRIASYTLAGVAAGALGGQLLGVLALDDARFYGKLVSGGFLIALGLYLAGWPQALGALERWGAHAWRRIEPLGRRYLPVRRPRQALALGLVWGWLPCGLVYAALAWALVAGSALGGGALMLAFGFGTLPTLLAIGASARWLGEIVRNTVVRRTAGIAIVLFGIYAMTAPMAHRSADHASVTQTAPPVLASLSGQLNSLRVRVAGPRPAGEAAVRAG
jgi:sulfite exporter TauE/SafE